jgi:outer membrane protein assembly factor BamB
VAYNAATDRFAWAAGDAELSYCSLQLTTIDGVEQAVITSGHGMTAFDPSDGTVLWNHDWLIEKAARCVQPGVIADGDLLLGTGFGNGTRRVKITREGDKWKDKEVWTTRAFNPYFNDFVVHDNHLYGFNNDVFTCVNLDKGKVQWKERGYGCGQVLLLQDQKLLLVVSEQGEVALLEANPEEQKELAKFQAIEGKTWNHPVVAHGRLYVRNGVEAACYQLPEPNPQ